MSGSRTQHSDAGGLEPPRSYIYVTMKWVGDMFSFENSHLSLLIGFGPCSEKTKCQASRFKLLSCSSHWSMIFMI